MSKRYACSLRWLWLSTFVILIDQLSKYWFSTHFSLYEYHALSSWFGFTLLHNAGAAFSFLSNAGGWQRWIFVIIAVVISLSLLVWLKRCHVKMVLQPVAIALILGGALGNLVDRIMHGYVIDFILFHYNKWYFPAFNLADSAITVGAILLLLHAIFSKR